MSDINISMNLNDQGSIKSKTNDTKELNKELTRAQNIATKMAPARAGYRSSGSTGSAPSNEGVEYGQARAAGGTGAAGRDFAKQAQGLGGLVHVYATFAANLFAVSAAFRALSEAADTTNMAKGMDQLGSAVGKSLGTIAQRLVETTDGAISFREAMEATTKGTAAGLSSAQMGQMAEVAKKASQSLGISMPDAISRLSRGISKLEPELLDELGLYTKLDKSTQDYARSIGKTATSLTDFERRQAFANAVLKEGLDKFSGVELAANPYDKLLASLKNVGQQSLEVVNKALTPLVTLLAASPSGLLAVLTGIGVILLKQAIPALGQYRESLAATAESSRLQFAKIYKDQQASLEENMLNSATNAEAAYRASSNVLKRTKALSSSVNSAWDSAKVKWSQLAAKDPFELTDKEIKSLQTRANTIAKSNKAEADALRAHIQEIKALRLGASTAGDIAQQAAETRGTGAFSSIGANEIIYRRQMTSAVADNIKSIVAEKQALYGASSAWSTLKDELNKAKAGMQKVKVGVDDAGNALYETAPKMGTVKAGLTQLSAGFGIVTTKIGTTLNALSPWLVGLGLASEALSLFDSWMTKTAKEQDNFNKSLQSISDSVDNVTRTLDFLNKKDLGTFTISGIFALSNAMTELTDATNAAMSSQEHLKNGFKDSWWDSAENSIAKLWGGDIDTEMASSLTKSLQSSLKIMSKAGLGDKAKQDFMSALGVTSLDTKTLNKAFKDNISTQKAFEEAQKELSTELNKSNSALQTFKSTTENSTKAYQEFIQSTAINNPLFKLGASLEDVGTAMQKLSTGSIANITAAFADLSANPEKFTLFGKAFVDQFVAIKQEFDTTLAAYSRYTKGVEIENAKIEAANNKIAESRARVAKSPNFAREEKFVQDKELARISIAQANKASLVDPSTAVFEKAKKLFIEGAGTAFTKGSELISQALGQAAEKAAITIAQAKLGSLSGERLATETTALKQEELRLQIKAIDTNIGLIKSQEELKASIDLATATSEASKTEGKTQVQKDMDQAALIAAKKFKEVLEGKAEDVSKGFLSGTSKDVISTGNADADAILKLKVLGIRRQTAQQEAARTGVQAQSTAESIAGQRAVAAGRLQDLQKIQQLNTDISQQELNRLSI